MKNLCPRICQRIFVTEVNLIRAKIGEKRATRYVVIFKKGERNGRELYYQWKTGAKFFTKYFRLLFMNFQNNNQLRENQPQKFLTQFTRLSADIRILWLKETLEEINNLINNQNVLVDEPERGNPVTSRMDAYRSNIQSDISLDKLNLKIVII